MEDNYDIIVYIVTGIFVGLIAIWNFFIQRKVKNLDFLREVFFKGTKAKDLESVIMKQKQEIANLESEIQKANLKINNAKRIAESSIQKIGVVRYDTFKNDGGNQSFSVAMLNRDNKGLVLSGLNSRDGGRFYTKPVEDSDSQYTLSDEEKKAIKEANKDIR